MDTLKINGEVKKQNHYVYNIEKKSPFNHIGGTLPSYIQVNISSNVEDITTKPLIPFCRSTRDEFIEFNRALYLKLFVLFTATQFYIESHL